MGLLDGKNALVFGVANNHSIAWGITEAFHREGANIGLSYAGEVLEKRVKPLAASIGCRFVEECDVTSDEAIAAVAQKAGETFGKIDILVHAVAYANREDLSRPFVQTSRAGFKMALDISAFSLVALTNAFLPYMGPGSSVVTLTYYGSEKVAPNYNVMGVAKAALEASVRYLAYDLGPQGIRVNAISAGPIRTLAAAGVAGFKTMYKEFADMAPLRQNVTIEDCGNAALYLCSDLSARVTGEVLFVDSGYNIMAVPSPNKGENTGG